MEHYVKEFMKNGINGPLNWYRLRKINWEEETKMPDGNKTVIKQPTLYIFATRDEVLTKDLAMGMQMSNIDIARFHRNASGGAAAHAAHVTRYLRQRKEIERLEKLYNTHINTPFSQDGALPWELYSR